MTEMIVGFAMTGLALAFIAVGEYIAYKLENEEGVDNI